MLINHYPNANLPVAFPPNVIQPNVIQPNDIQPNVIQPNVIQSNVNLPNAIWATVSIIGNDSGAVFTTLYFLHYLRMGSVS